MKAGDKVNDIDIFGSTPLHFTLTNGKGERLLLEIVELLIQEWPDLNLKNKHNETVLEIAKKKGYKKIAKLISIYQQTYRDVPSSLWVSGRK